MRIFRILGLIVLSLASVPMSYAQVPGPAARTTATPAAPETNADPLMPTVLQSVSSEPVGSDVHMLAGDVNGDGDRDLLMMQAGRIEVYLGTGAGVAATPALTLTDFIESDYQSPRWALGNVNGDAFDDLILLRSTGGSGAAVEIYPGSASGLPATPAAALAPINSIRWIVAEDVNGDGYADIALLQGDSTVRVFPGSAAGLTATPWIINAPEGQTFAYAMDGLGDTNGDGYADLGLILTEQLETGEVRKVAIYHGTASGISATPGRVLNNTSDGWFFELTGLGDVNGDGYADVGYSYLSDGEILPQLAIFLGSPAGVQPDPWLFQRWRDLLALNSSYPALVEGIGDINGDGYADLALTNLFKMDDGLLPGACIQLGHSHGLTNQCDAFVPALVPDAFDIPSHAVGVGDMDGDGRDDLTISDLTESGVVHVQLLTATASGYLPQPTEVLTSAETIAASAGDVNGDGYGDVLRGDPAAGTARLYLGAAAGLGTAAAWIYTSPITNYGTVLARAGDVNGDGYADVLVGADTLDVFLGTATGLAATPAATVPAANGAPPLPAGAGDMNGDGYGDVLIALTSTSELAWYPGSSTGLATEAAWTWAVSELGSMYHLAAAGDVDGDGFADALFSVADAGNGDGWATLIRGTPTTPQLAWTEAGAAASAFGTSVLSAGDVNGDGYADVAVGAPGSDAVTLFHGQPAAPWLVATQTLTDPRPEMTLGSMLVAVGDINRDGYSDIGVVAETTDPAGAALRLYASDGTGWDTAPFETLPLAVDAPVALETAQPLAADTNGDGVAEILLQAAQPNQPLYSYTPTTLREVLGHAPTRRLGSPETIGFTTTRLNDVNGDGFDDVGVAQFAVPGPFSLRIDLVLGGPDGEPGAQMLLAEADHQLYLEAAGDVNGDGYSDALLSDADALTATLYLGSAAGLVAGQSWSNYSTVGGAGDINGDGYSDVVMENEAFLDVYFGSAVGLSAQPNWQDVRSPGIGIERMFGAGDVDGDGFGDLLIRDTAGFATLIYGALNGLDSRAWSTSINNLFLDSLTALGDVNADGYADVAAVETDTVKIFYGRPGGLENTPDQLVSPWVGGSDARIALGGGSDINNDGFDDLLVGWSFGSWVQGRAAVFTGSAEGLNLQEAWLHDEPRAEMDGTNTFGWSVKALGDIDGDGLGDIGVADFTTADELPSLAVFSPLVAPGRTLRPQQLRADGSAPIALDGVVIGDAFRVAVDASAPHGRAAVRLEWEVQPIGTPFTGVPTGRGAWTDTTTAGVALSGLVADLAADTDYTWRARLAYHPSALPPTPVSAWFTRAAAGAGDPLVHVGPPLPTLALASASVAEPDSGSATTLVEVTLSEVSAQPVTLQVQTQPGTATPNADYVPFSTTLVFAPDMTVQTLPITVLGDLLAEADETFTLVVSDVTNATVTTPTATVTIADNDAAPVLALAPLSLEVNEPDSGTLHTVVMVTLSAASGLPVTAQVQTQPGTATPNADYVPFSTTLTFAPGMTAQTLPITVLGDLVAEADETFTLVVSDVTNATVTTPTATVTIADNDLAGLLLTTTALTVTEDGVTDTLGLALRAQPQAAVTVTVTFTATDQLSVTPLTLVFTPENWATPQVLTVGAVDDALVEAPLLTELVLHIASSDPAYAEQAARTVPVTVLDNDVAPPSYSIFVPFIQR